MPHLNPDNAATDEAKTYKYEANGVEDDNDLSEIKVDLVDEDDRDAPEQPYKNKSTSHRHESSKENISDQHHNLESGRSRFPYIHSNIDPLTSGIPPFFQNNFLPSSQIPYSHYIRPYFLAAPTSIDLDRKQGIPRLQPSDIPPMYSLPGQLGQVPNPLAPWSAPSLYPLCTASAMAGMLRYPYPFPAFSSSASVGCVSPFSLSSPHHNGFHPNIAGPRNHPFARRVSGDGNKAIDKRNPESTKRDQSTTKASRPYVKKPLNAFMIYMKEQRARVVAECTLKESAAINQILGRKWHSLDKEEQQKYYEMARKERQLHMEQHPSWSARDNYGKRKKRKKEKVHDCTGQNAKKCRAVYGLEQQQRWCAPCRRKKKCIRYHPDGEESDELDTSPQQFDASDSSSLLPLSSTETSANRSKSNQSSFTSDDISYVKREKSPPAILDIRRSKAETSPAERINSNKGTTANRNSMKNNDLQSKQQSSFVPGREFEESLRLLSSSLSSPSENHGKRSSSNSDLSSNHSGGSKQTLYNSPLMSPNNPALVSPRSSHFPNFSYLATAAGLPASLGGFIGFPNFNNITSPMHMGPGSPVGHLSHVPATAPRLTSSAVEGRS